MFRKPTFNMFSNLYVRITFEFQFKPQILVLPPKMDFKIMEFGLIPMYLGSGSKTLF